MNASAIKAVIREVFTDSVASERVGYPVKCGLMSDFNASGDTGWPDALFIRPADVTAITHSDKPAYAYYKLDPRGAESVSELAEKVFIALCDEWREKCLPNVEPA